MNLLFSSRARAGFVAAAAVWIARMTFEHLAGCLTLTLTHDGAAVTHCHSEFSRPPLAAACWLAPPLLTPPPGWRRCLCAAARHALAADLAAQALHGPAAPALRRWPSWAEARQDILRRVALDWPHWPAATARTPTLSPPCAQPAALGQALQDYVLGEPCADWLARGYHGWLAWGASATPNTPGGWRI